MKKLIKVVMLFVIFSILFVLPNIVIPLHVKVGNQSGNNSLMLILLLLTQFFVIIYLVTRLNLAGMKLFLAVAIVFWGLQTFMPQLETWYFREAMPMISNNELVNLFLRPLITSLTFIPLAIWILGKWNRDRSPSESYTSETLTWKEILTLSIAYVFIYFAFGYYVAWQFDAVRVFYSGSSEDLGLIGQIKETLHTKNLIFLFQLFRGFLWIIIGFPVLHYLKGGKTEKIIACMLLYSLPAIQLIVDNPFMPQPVRVAHLLEVATSNGVFGLLIGYVSTRRGQ